MWAALVLGVFAGAGAVLSAVDIRSRRIPNRLLLPFGVAVFVLLAAAIAADWDGPSRLISTLGGAVAAFGLLLLLWLALPTGIGGGDVKLAPLVGAVLGFFGSWSAVLAGLLLAFLFAAVWGLVLKRRGGGTGAPFAPCLFAGAWAGVVMTTFASF